MEDLIKRISNAISLILLFVLSAVFYFSADERAAVIPFESPTVPNAEAASKKSSPALNVPALSEADSEMSKSAYITQRRQTPFTNTASAFSVDSSAMSRRKTDGAFLSEARL